MRNTGSRGSSSASSSSCASSACSRTPPVSPTGGSIRSPGSKRDAWIDEILLRVTAGTELPVAVGLDFSHTDPLLTLPWGVRARLEAGDDVTLELLEPAVL